MTRPENTTRYGNAVSEREAWLRRFHAARPGITSTAFARAGSYERLAALVPSGRVLDLGCGDGHLARLIGDRCVGIDLSLDELARAGGVPVVQGRAQALPFPDGAFDACVSHLAFMLFDDIERVVAELGRVLVPGGRFLALLGGGPTAAGDDAFHRFLALLRPHLRAPVRFGDLRAKREPGWRELFAGWRDVAFERWELDLGGSFDQVWQFLGATYELAPEIETHVREQLRASSSNPHLPCRVVTWLAIATR